MFDRTSSLRRRALLLACVSPASLLLVPTDAHAAPISDQVVTRQAESDTDVPGIDSSGTESDGADDDIAAEQALLDVCPLDGPSTFEDSWGWARSGGRSHEGVDMIADRGTPILAVRDGDAVFKQNRLGGNAVWLTTPDGDKFYYAHLDGFAGESRTVAAGELIGFVGSTGNAHGPHLHFETLPGGAVENPFPHTLGACVPTPDEVAELMRSASSDLDDVVVMDPSLPDA